MLLLSTTNIEEEALRMTPEKSRNEITNSIPTKIYISQEPESTSSDSNTLHVPMNYDMTCLGKTLHWPFEENDSFLP